MTKEGTAPGQMFQHSHYRCPEFLSESSSSKNDATAASNTSTTAPSTSPNKENTRSSILANTNNPIIGPSKPPLKSPTTARRGSKFTTPVKVQSFSPPLKLAVESASKSQPTNYEKTITSITTTPSSSFHHSKIKTPTGTSKLLRKHFQRLALSASPSKNNNSARLLQSGPVRLPPPINLLQQKNHSDSKLFTSRRIGYDGTIHTPSKELLKSTASSRSHRYDPSHSITPTTAQLSTGNNRSPPSPSPYQNLGNDKGKLKAKMTITPVASTPATEDDNATIGSIDSSLFLRVVNTFDDDEEYSDNIDRTLVHMQQNHDQQLPSTPSSRKACPDPVAWTLLNDGKEDLPFLLQQDQEISITKSNMDNVDESFLSLTPSEDSVSPAQVSARLSLSMRNIARPIAIVASSSSTISPISNSRNSRTTNMNAIGRGNLSSNPAAKLYLNDEQQP